MAESTVFEEVVRNCGLSSIFARATVIKVAQRAGVSAPEALTSEELARLLPELERSLIAFLGRDAAEAPMKTLSRLARR